MTDILLPNRQDTLNRASNIGHEWDFLMDTPDNLSIFERGEATHSFGSGGLHLDAGSSEGDEVGIRLGIDSAYYPNYRRFTLSAICDHTRSTRWEDKAYFGIFGQHSDNKSGVGIVVSEEEFGGAIAGEINSDGELETGDDDLSSFVRRDPLIIWMEYDGVENTFEYAYSFSGGLDGGVVEGVSLGVANSRATPMFVENIGFDSSTLGLRYLSVGFSPTR